MNCISVTGGFKQVGRDRYYDFYYTTLKGTPETAGFQVSHQYLDTRGTVVEYTDAQAIEKSWYDVASMLGVPVEEICQYNEAHPIIAEKPIEEMKTAIASSVETIKKSTIIPLLLGVGVLIVVFIYLFQRR